MEGRVGKPWIFRDIRHYLDTGEILPEPSLDEKVDLRIKPDLSLAHKEKQGCI
ncbi:MAG: hypothetical protein R2727_08960 [Bacteroidales bacterium]